jgi:hypothetical protein
MVAALAQLHHHVEQPAAVSTAVKGVNVLLQQSSVPAHTYVHTSNKPFHLIQPASSASQVQVQHYITAAADW